MTPLYHDAHFTFRFADDRIIPRFHLEGIEAGRRVLVFKIDPGTGEKLGLLATATVGEGEARRASAGPTRRGGGTARWRHRRGDGGARRRVGGGASAAASGAIVLEHSDSTRTERAYQPSLGNSYPFGTTTTLFSDTVKR
jgi:hypothetical protein